MCALNLQDGSEFYSRIAPAYDAQMEQNPSNAWIRAAFRQMVCEATPPGALLLDFGCGTGIDTVWYAGQGYRVLSYDYSCGMMEQMRRRCAAEIASGQVIPLIGDYAAFPDLLQRRIGIEAIRTESAGLAAIVANFAVLNHIDDLESLFTLFAGQMTPAGQVIVSVLNPFFWQDVRQRIWWRPCLRSLKTHRVVWTSEAATQYRHYISRVVRSAAPHFVKVEQAGVATFFPDGGGECRCHWDDPRSLPERIEARYWRSAPLRHLGKFIFLRFRRNGTASS